MSKKPSHVLPENIVEAVALVEAIRNNRLDIPTENTEKFLMDVKKKLNAAQVFFQRASKDQDIMKYLNDLAAA